MKTSQMLDLALLAARQVFSGAAMPDTGMAHMPPVEPIQLPDGKYTMEDGGAFFRYVRDNITGPLDQIQVDTINRILEGANHWHVGELANALGTAWHECLLRPISEWGKGRGKKYGKPGKYGQAPYGRGLVQLTWDFNYEWADAALGLNGALLRNFDLALEPDIAARILVIGMETGAFTGKGNRNYLPHDDTPATLEQFIRARRIINGTDKAEKIARHSLKFQQAAIVGKWKD